MLALRFDGSEVRVEEVESPTLPPRHARIRVRRAGICSTDLHIVRGYMGFTGTLGHEFVGEVIECSDGSWLGRRVTGEINLGCGECPLCLRGLSRHCPHRRVLGILGCDGCFAEELTLPIANLHRIPDEVDDSIAAFVEPLAAAYEILEQVRIDPDSRVAVLGDGKLGLLVSLVLCNTGAETWLFGRHPDKLARIQGSGVHTSTELDAEASSFDLVVEATGNPSGFADAQRLLRPRGTLVLKSTFHGKLELDTAPLVIDELTVIGSRCGPFAPAIRALADRRVDPTPLLTDSFALEEGVHALDRARSPGVLKVQLILSRA